jgi:tetratricopeptide (TPR) repeat protein
MLILFVGIGIYFLSRKMDKPGSQQPHTTAYKQAETNALHYAATADSSGHFDEEIIILKSYLKTNPPKQYTYLPLIQLADAEYNQRDYSAAVAYYKQAEAKQGKIQEVDAAGIAMSAQAEGDNATAIYYYKQAIKHTIVTPGVGNSITDYKETISSLGGTP